MRLRQFSILFLTVMMMALPAFALDLHQARSSGLIGEKLDGYVQAMKKTPEVEALVKDVNAKRRQEYSRISGENNQPVDVVAKLAAAQIINKLEPGSYYQAPDASWKTR